MRSSLSCAPAIMTVATHTRAGGEWHKGVPVIRAEEALGLELERIFPVVGWAEQRRRREWKE